MACFGCKLSYEKLHEMRNQLPISLFEKHRMQITPGINIDLGNWGGRQERDGGIKGQLD